MKNDLIYATTTTSSEVLSGGIIPLTTTSRRVGCSISLNGNSIILKTPGYYKVSGTITGTASNNDLITIELFKNATLVPGAKASFTASATDDYFTLPIEATIRVYCHEGTPSLTLINTGIGVTITNVALDVYAR